MLRDLEYVPGGHKRQRLDLYFPDQMGRPLPLIVWIHGGAFRVGSKDQGGPALSLLNKGYAVACINYRLSHQAHFPAQIEDCKAAIRWLRANSSQYHLNPDQIGVWGASAGGYLAALLGTAGDVLDWEQLGGHQDQSSHVQAVVDWFGPTDFTKLGDRHNAANSPESQLLGGPVQENLVKAQQANPIHYISATTPPFLIMHGDQDRLLPLHQSQLLADALQQVQVDVTFLILAGGGHGGREFHRLENLQRVEQFFDKYLKGSEKTE